MAIELGYSLISTIFKDTLFFDISWIMSVILTLISLLIITRDTNEWKKLALPVMVGWHVAGIPPFFPLYILGAMLFTIENLSLKSIGQLLKVTKVSLPKDELRETTLSEAKKLMRRKKKAEIKLFDESSGKLGVLSKKELKDIRKLGLGKR